MIVAAHRTAWRAEVFRAAGAFAGLTQGGEFRAFGACGGGGAAGQSRAAFHQAMFSRYHATVAARPSSKERRGS